MAIVRRLVCLCAVAACAGPPTSANVPDAGPPPFTFQPELEALPAAVLDVWLGDDEAIAVGGDSDTPLLLEWTGGATWLERALPAGIGVLWWTWGEPGADAFAVGDGGVILRRSAGLWRVEPMDGLVADGITLYGVHGSSETDVWVVGGSLTPGTAPAILHWDGTIWTAFDTSALPAVPLFKVWAAGTGDVWIVGDQGTILHGDGTTFQQVLSPTTSRLIAIYGRAADEIYAVGGNQTGEVLASDGNFWTPFATTSDPLSGVWTAPGRALYVAGNNGYLARYGGADDADPDATKLDETRANLENVDFHSLGGGASAVIAVGADLLGGSRGAWNGALVTHGTPTASQILVEALPDAGADAPIDAATSPADAPPADAAGTDAPGADQPCTGACAPGLECWPLQADGVARCTKTCASPGDCGTDFGPSPCCHVPGPQTFTTVCVDSTNTTTCTL
jgi:hypothetical protein